MNTLHEHTSVLLQEAIDGLQLEHGDSVLDATVGSAGHSLEICRRFGKEVRIIALDADPERMAEATKALATHECNATVVHENFRNLDLVLAREKVKTVQGVLFDLGLNSEQLGASGRGFSFLYDEPLYMTFDEPHSGMVTAYEIVNHFDETALARIIFEYGEERYSRRIAKRIVEARRSRPIKTTFELVDVIKRAVPRGYERGRLHAATRTFQALRIAVNDELEALSEGLAKGFAALSSEGRMAVIAFHSLEDRIVKRYFRSKADSDEATLITKKPFTASLRELADNPRSRSAKLRIIQKK